ncbi:MAG: DUF1801 domain-containing protein [Leptospiraceae bacterium]|jgi:hypothetical protein|nr:DUF1801 domain-containing protein [Leptospiraceae bacterium]MCZ8346093.1 DUF1801 domain-containing protein [Leptospiraceae bacterium]PJE02261.1 MAG: hypothetical protein CK427_08255 [Leptospira sp.]
MSKKIELKTAKNDSNPQSYLSKIADQKLKEDCYTLYKLFEQATGLPAKMWGDSIIGFGEYTYFRSNGDEGQFMASGFSARKSGPTIYILPGSNDYSKELEKLGPHKLGKSCLYLKSLEGIDFKVLSKLIQKGMKDLKKKYKTNY